MRENELDFLSRKCGDLICSKFGSYCFVFVISINSCSNGSFSNSSNSSSYSSGSSSNNGSNSSYSYSYSSYSSGNSSSSGEDCLSSLRPPALHDLRISNRFWQVLKVGPSRDRVYLYSAFYDDRAKVLCKL